MDKLKVADAGAAPTAAEQTLAKTGLARQLKKRLDALNAQIGPMRSLAIALASATNELNMSVDKALEASGAEKRKVIHDYQKSQRKKAITDAIKETKAGEKLAAGVKFVPGKLFTQTLVEKMQEDTAKLKMQLGQFFDLYMEGIKSAQRLRTEADKALAGTPEERAKAFAGFEKRERTKKYREEFDTERRSGMGFFEKLADTGVFSRVFVVNRLLQNLGVVTLLNLRRGVALAVTALAAFASAIIGVIKVVLKFISIINQVLLAAIKAVFSIIVGIVKAAISVVVSIIRTGFGIVGKILETVFSFAVGVVRNATKTIIGFILAMTAALGVALKKFADFQSNMAQIWTQLPGTTRKTLGEFQKIITDTMRQLPIDSKEATDAMFDIISTGFNTLAKATQIFGAASRLAVAGGASLKDTTSSLISILKGYNMTAEESDRVTNILMKTQRLGRTTIQQVAASIGRVAGVAGIAGVSLEEMAAAFATTTLQLAGPRYAATALRQLMIGMATPTDKARKHFESLGISFTRMDEHGFQVNKTFEELLPSLAKLDLASLLSAAKTERGLGALASMVKLLKDFQSILGEMKTPTDEVGGAIPKMLETIKAQFKLARNAVENFYIKLYDLQSLKIAGFIANLANNINRFTDWVFEAENGVTRFERGLNMVVDAINPVWQALQLVGKYLKEAFKDTDFGAIFIKILTKIANAILTVTAVVLNLKNVFKEVSAILVREFSKPFQKLFILASTVFDMLFSRDTLTAMQADLKAIFGSIIDFIVDTLDKNAASISGFIFDFYYELGAIAGRALWEGFKSTFSQLGRTINEKAFTAVAKLFRLDPKEIEEGLKFIREAHKVTGDNESIQRIKESATSRIGSVIESGKRLGANFQMGKFNTPAGSQTWTRVAGILQASKELMMEQNGIIDQFSNAADISGRDITTLLKVLVNIVGAEFPKFREALNALANALMPIKGPGLRPPPPLTEAPGIGPANVTIPYPELTREQRQERLENARSRSRKAREERDINQKILEIRQKAIGRLGTAGAFDPTRMLLTREPSEDLDKQYNELDKRYSELLDERLVIWNKYPRVSSYADLKKVASPEDYAKMMENSDESNRIYNKKKILGVRLRKPAYLQNRYTSEDVRETEDIITQAEEELEKREEQKEQAEKFEAINQAVDELVKRDFTGLAALFEETMLKLLNNSNKNAEEMGKLKVALLKLLGIIPGVRPNVNQESGASAGIGGSTMN